MYRRLPGGDAKNIASALAGVGRIRPATCLEGLLWQAQHRRYPMLRHPTEFGAFVLQKGQRLRLYFSAMDRLGQKLRSAVMSRVRHDVAGGFRLVAHLHNHPFLFDRKPGDRLYSTAATQQDVGGALAPSATDVQLYRRLRRTLHLEAAWITNGFDTAVYAHSTFGRLEAAPDRPEKYAD